VYNDHNERVSKEACMGEGYPEAVNVVNRAFEEDCVVK
jgi:hypothetical protein